MTIKTKSAVLTVTDVDELSTEQIGERLKETRVHIEAIRALWPGLVKLEEKERRSTVGRTLTQLGAPLRELFTLLAPKNGKAPAIAGVFDVLGDQDEGEDPERFEPELLLRRLDRVEAENAVVEDLEALCRDLGDDVLATGEKVVVPGLLALNLAKSVSNGNATYRSALRSVLDGFREMTKRARTSSKAARDTEAAAAEAGSVAAAAGSAAVNK